MNTQGLDIEHFGLFHCAIHGLPASPSLEAFSSRLASSDDHLDDPCLVVPRDHLGCIDAAIFTIAALQGSGPRRLIVVSPTLPIIDTTWHRACTLQRSLQTPRSPITASVTEALLAMAGEHAAVGTEPFSVGRGWPRVAASSIWCRSPAQPTVLCTDAAQFTSDLLFRSRGAPSVQWPLFAGLAGCDSLVMTLNLPSQHPLRAILQSVTRAQSRTERIAGLEPLRWIDVIADLDETISLQPADSSTPRASPATHDALASTAALRTTSLHTDSLATSIHALSRSILPSVSARLLVVLPDEQAVLAAERLLRKDLPPGVELLTAVASLRELERSRLESHLLGVAPAHTPALRQVLLSTPLISQSVGLDCDTLVAFADAGHLPRDLELFISGLDGPAPRVFILVPADSTHSPSGPPQELPAAVTPLSDVTLDGFAAFELRSATTLASRATHVADDRNAFAGVSGRDTRGIRSLEPPRSVPSLLPAHLSMLARTSPPAASPDVSCFTGLDRLTEQDCKLCWRIDLPSVLAGQAALEDYAWALPPMPGECITAAIGTVRTWLLRSEPECSSSLNGDAAATPVARPPRIARIASVDRSVSWLSTLAAIAPGDVLMIADHPRHESRSHGVDGLPTATSFAGRSMIDCSDEAWCQDGGSIRLRVTAAVLDAYSRQTGVSIHWPLESMPPDPGLLLRDLARVSRQLLRPMGRQRLGPSEHALLKSVLHAIDGGTRFRFVRHPCGGFVIHSIPFAEQSWLELPDDQTPGIGSLERHTAEVVRCTERFASSLSLTRVVSTSLAYAARWHDTGKSDHRYQGFIRGGFAALPCLARPSHSRPPSSTELHRCLAGWPRLGRHELLSVDAARRAFAQADHGQGCCDEALTMHLVATHHGHGRPFLHPLDADREASVMRPGPPFPGDSDDLQTGFHASSGGRFEMMNARYGLWGLAYLESILRIADARCVESELRAMEGDSGDFTPGSGQWP